MRKIAWFVLFVLVTGISLALAQDWREYRPPGVGFSIELPGEWKASGQDIDTAAGKIKVNLVSLELNGREYVCVYSTYPAEAIRGRPVSAILDGARDGAIGDMKGKLLKEDKIQISNLEARQLIVEAPDGDIGVIRLLMVENTLVQAIVGGKPGVETDPATKRVMDSLKVVGR